MALFHFVSHCTNYFINKFLTMVSAEYGFGRGCGFGGCTTTTTTTTSPPPGHQYESKMDPERNNETPVPDVLMLMCGLMVVYVCISVGLRVFR